MVFAASHSRLGEEWENTELIGKQGGAKRHQDFLGKFNALNGYHLIASG
jgi:hypothetical protein